jgi:hypothetical protein
MMIVSAHPIFNAKDLLGSAARLALLVSCPKNIRAARRRP